MLDRRLKVRGRVYYGGVIAFNARNSTMQCVVRNFSPFGAKVEFDNTALLPDEVDFTIPPEGFFLAGPNYLAPRQRGRLRVPRSKAVERADSAGLGNSPARQRTCQERLAAAYRTTPFRALSAISSLRRQTAIDQLLTFIFRSTRQAWPACRMRPQRSSAEARVSVPIRT